MGRPIIRTTDLSTFFVQGETGRPGPTGPPGTRGPAVSDRYLNVLKSVSMKTQ